MVLGGSKQLCLTFEGPAGQVLGRALKDIPRDSVVVATKVGRYGEADFDFSAGRVTSSVVESLRRLNLDYLDIIHCHDIEFGNLDQVLMAAVPVDAAGCTVLQRTCACPFPRVNQQVINETLPALQKLKAQGLVRFIGITGRNTPLLWMSKLGFCLVTSTCASGRAPAQSLQARPRQGPSGHG